MIRTSPALVLLALFAGVAGGIGVQLVFRSTESPPPSAAADPARAPTGDEAASALRREVRELRLALDSAAARIAELEAGDAERDKATEEMRRQADLVSRLDEARVKVGPSGVAPTPLPRGTRFVSMGGGKAAELLAMPEEDRWAKVREELSLDSYQESELRRISEELKASMRDLFQVNPDTGRPEGKIDFGKLISARQDADERVKNLLSPDQYAKYQEGGYGTVLGTGSGVSVAFSTSTSREPEDK